MTGKTLQELAAEIERQQNSKHDYVAPADGKLVAMAEEDGDLKLIVGTKQFEIGDIAHQQIAEHTGVPKAYYDKMRGEAPDLLATNVDRWFEKYPTPRMIRTLDTRARAFLSDKFALLDNYDFADAALPIIYDRKLDIVSCDITERRLYIKVIDKQEFNVPVGHKMGDGTHTIFDVCCPALILSNSEVGFGRLVVETGVYTKVCTNLAWFARGGFKRTHIGARHRFTEGLAVDDLDQIMSDQTKRKTQEALWLQVRDVVASAFDPAVIKQRSEQLTTAAKNKIAPSQVNEIVEVTGERFGFNETEKGSILEHLIGGGNLSQYGLHSAITRAAQDVADYDRATTLEYIGGSVLELSRTEWSAMADAA